MNNIVKKVIIINMLFIIFLYSNISLAASMNELKNEKNNVSSSISETEKELDDISDEKSETLEQVEKLITQISDYKSEIDELNTNISNLETKISSTEKKIAEDEAEYKKEDEKLNERLVAMYQSGDTTYLDFLLSSASIVDFISSYYLVSEVTDYDTQMLEEIEEHKQKIENEKAELENDKSELEKSKTTVQSRQQALEVAKKEKDEYIDQLTEKEKSAQEKLQDLQDTNDELDQQIKEAQEKIAQARAAAQARATANTAGKNTGISTTHYAPSSSTDTSSSGFIWPVYTRYSVTTGWYYSSGSLHGGVDFSGSGICGTPVYAVSDGYVVTSTAKMRNGKYISYGNYILIAHYNGLYTLYAHLSSRSVSAGQTVSQGQVIGTVGSTGNSSGPHLHFEVRTNGKFASRVYPMNYLP